MKISITIITFFVGIICLSLGDPVTNVPGFIGDLPFKAYSGYLPANDGDKQMFYFFAESLNDSANAPVVLWLNGGPGCSSFDGWVYENGPFFFNSGKMGAGQNLTLNPYAWNRVANMIWLDSPCGVGLSYSNNPNIDYVTNDTTTAHDSHNFLLNFFAVYPQFKDNDFYISGESYAGIYIPTLAQQVVLGNIANPSTAINLKGILVGNGVTDEVFDGNAWVPFIWGHSFISNILWLQIQQSCGNNYWNNSGDECNNLLNNASNDASNNNIYNVYLPCYMGPEQTSKLHSLEYRYTSRVRESAKDPQFAPPCIDADAATDYFNLPEVRTAFNAVPVSEVEWTICSDSIDYTSLYSTVIPVHKYLLSQGIRILIYSGDADMCVPHTGSESWTESLNLPLVDEWRPWFVDNQVGGYVRAYKGLTFATIKGAGHMVPQYRPPQAFHFFSSFLNQQPF